MKILLMAFLVLFCVFAPNFKSVMQIESCNKSGRCRVYFDDNSTDLLYNPYIGMRVKK